jgi:hypothetical protein
MVIVIFFDNKYFHFVDPLLTSIKIYEPCAKVYAHTFNLSKDQKDELKKHSNIYHIVEEEIEFDPNIADEYHGQLNKGKPLRFQLTCRRGEYLLNAMDVFPDEDLFIITDIDTLMINPLNELKSQMLNYDVGLVYVNENKICSGFFVVRPTENGKLYLKSFYDTAMNGRLFLCKDQKSLAKVYEDMKRDIDFLFIDRRYLDHTLSGDSFMWSGHKSRFGNKEERYKKYLEKLKEMK